MAESFEVNGLLLKPNTLYRVVSKPDNNAYEGLKQYGSTKLPQLGMSNFIQCPYSSESGTYDTGFYTQSPCYKGLSQSIREKNVDILNELIIQPFEKVYGFGILDNKNESFWSELDVELYESRLFNTSDVKDFLELYIAMRGYELVPRKKLGDPRFMNAQFIIEDKDVTTKMKNERKQNYMEALQNFFVTLSSEKHKLIAILKYANMNGAVHLDNDTNDATINALFKDWVDSDTKNVDNFLRISGLASKKAGMEEITMYSLLLELQSKKKVYRVGDEYVYEEVPLGADLKTAAKNLVSKRALKDIKQSILNQETTD